MSQREDGFSLIEVAVAVSLFGIILIGMSVLFQSAFRTTGQARTRQQAKAVAQETLEELRSLPYYESRRVTTAPVDVLDRYFPDTQTTDHATPTGAVGRYDGALNVWTFTSERTVTKPDAPGFTLSVSAQFVIPNSDGTLRPIAPIAGYSSTTVDVDRPASDTLKIVATVGYTEQGTSRSVALDTLVTRVKQQAPKLEASGSVLGVSISGVLFQDGDVGGVGAEVLGEVGVASTNFREVTDSSSQATATPVSVTERRTDNSNNVQSALPTGGGSTATVPNSTTGNIQAQTSFLAGGSMSSINLPTATIASWCTTADDDCQSSSAARVSTTHIQLPEGKATFNARSFQLNARDSLESASHRVLTTTSVTGDVEQRSTTNESRVTSTVTIGNLKVWGSTSFVANPRYEGTVIIDQLRVTVVSVAGSTSASNSVVWRIDNLRVWDPNKLNANGTIGGYGTSYTFGFDSGCGQWTVNPVTCGPPFENPNPVVIPAAYSGVSGGQSASSLVIVTGATIQEQTSDPGNGIGSANTSQKSVITITTREDVTGAAALEPSITTLGSATATVSYVKHVH